LWNNGQQVSPAHTVGCHCLFLALQLTPLDVDLFYVMLIAKSSLVDLFFSAISWCPLNCAAGWASGVAGPLAAWCGGQICRPIVLGF